MVKPIMIHSMVDNIDTIQYACDDSIENAQQQVFIFIACPTIVCGSKSQNE